MPVNEKTLRLLMEAGVTGDALFAIVRSIDEAEQVTRTVREQSVTPAAVRMRKMREKRAIEAEQKSEQLREQPNPTSKDSKGKEEEKKERDVGTRHKPSRRHAYPPRFTAFWEAYPTDPGMSKPEALTAWQRLLPDDQETAIAAIPAFKEWVKKQGPDYRTVHAVRYLSQSRFEGFAAQIDATWVKRLGLARSSKKWSVDEWGPMPGQDGCRVPSRLIESSDGAGWENWRPNGNVSQQTSEAA